MSDDEPIVERLECGCIRNIFEEIVRTDFCEHHADQKDREK